MPKIYRKVILGVETGFFYCDSCLNEANEPKLDWDDTILPGEGNAGVWKEAPLEKCGLCYAVDLQSREEMDAFHHDMSNRQWEEEQFASDQEMWEAHIRDPHGVIL